MSDNEFEIGGRHFKLRKITAFKQFHIVRRIGPILSELLPAMKAGIKTENLSEDEKLDNVAKFAAPIMEGLSKLSNADSELVFFGLLASAEMQQEHGNWANVSTESMLMIQDLELSVLLQIAGRAFMYNLAGFFSVLPQKSRGPTQQPLKGL